MVNCHHTGQDGADGSTSESQGSNKFGLVNFEGLHLITLKYILIVSICLFQNCILVGIAYTWHYIRLGVLND